MRLLLKLVSVKSPLLTANYYYPLSSAIYKLLQFGSPKFSEFLHNIGFKVEGKTYKLFTFALRFEKPPDIKNGIFYLKSNKVFLFISSPLIEDFIKNFVIGTFNKQKIEIYDSGIETAFEIEQVEALPKPRFSTTTHFTLLSPLVLATKKESNGKLIPKYFRYYDNINEIARVFNQNLFNKYKSIYNKTYKGEPLDFSWDIKYIDNRLSKNKKVTKLITAVINGNTINIKANQIPFILKGNTELMNVGYQCGFGQNNSLGFGLAKVTDKKNN